MIIHMNNMENVPQDYCPIFDQVYENLMFFCTAGGD